MFDGILGYIFDFNGDGQLDAFEEAAELAFIIEETRHIGPDGSDDPYDDLI